MLRLFFSTLSLFLVLSQLALASIEDTLITFPLESNELLSTKNIRQPEERELGGIWMPVNALLFKPLIADPRQVNYTLGVRFTDSITSNHSVAVALGDELPLFLWHGIRNWEGDFQLAIAAGAWSILDFDSQADDYVALVNTDFFIGFPLTYASKNWAYRLRLYHISSHLGDEFLVANPGVERTNPSVEVLDFMASHQLSESFRIYGGLGYNLRSDASFHVHPLYAEYGVEVFAFGFNDLFNKLRWQPFFAMHLRHNEDHGWEANRNFRIGYEWSKLEPKSDHGRKTRLYLELYDGYSLEGQFARERTTYFSLNIGMGY